MSQAYVWQKHYDENSNIYFYNTVDGSSQWEEPADYVEEYANPDEYANADEYANPEEYVYTEEHPNEEEYIQPEEYAYPEGYEYTAEGYEYNEQDYGASTSLGVTTTEDEQSGDGQTTELYEENDLIYDETPAAEYHSSEYETNVDTPEFYSEDQQLEEPGSTPVQEYANFEHSEQEVTSYEQPHDGTEYTYEHEYHDASNEQTYPEPIDCAYDEHTDVWPEYESEEIVEAVESNDVPPVINESTDQGHARYVEDHHDENEGQDVEEEFSERRDSERESLVDPATLVPHYSLEDQPLIDSILAFELDEGSGDFVGELRRLHLLEEISPSELTAISEGKWCKATCKKVEILQFCLENAGSEREWKEVVEERDGRLVKYLLLFMAKGVHPQLQDGAARCLAYTFMVCPILWTFFGALQEEEGTGGGADVGGKSGSGAFLYAVWSAAGTRVQFLCDLPAEGPCVGPYLGFDKRDIEDFNLYGLDDDYGEEVDKKTSPFEMRGSPDANTMVSIWCLVMFQMCRSNMRQIGDAFRNRRVMKLGLEGEAEGSVDPTDEFLAILSALLLCSHKLKEDSYLLLIKVVAAVNWQVPEKDLMGSTEIADMCAELQFQDISVSNVNVSEGLMHLLNDIGYPEHNQPESLPCLQLCYDLIMSAGYEGFFYQNDVRILIDMIIREVTNLPATKAKEEETLEKCLVDDSDSDGDDPGEKLYRTKQCTIDMNTGMSIFDGIDGPEELFSSEVVPFDELMKQMYLKIAVALFGRSCWQEFEDLYRKTELDDLLKSLLESNEINNDVTIDHINRFLSLQLD